MIYKVRDFAGRVPRDFGDEFRKDVLDTCLAVADVQRGTIDLAKREATFVITDPSVDSYGDVIDAGAFDKSLAQYMRNPVVLPEHRHTISGIADVAIVGHGTRIFAEGDKLLETIRFSERPIGANRWQAVQDGDLRAVSVGFRPVNYDIIDKVLHYKEALLKEVSTCPVGANDNALLVNHYIAGQLGKRAATDQDGGRVEELLAAMEELREEVEGLRATQTTGRANVARADEHSVTDDFAQRIGRVVETVGAATRQIAAA